MSLSVLKGKRLIAVDDEPDVLDILEEELEGYEVTLDKCVTYEDGILRITNLVYDLAILDIMGVKGFDLLQCATSKGLPVVVLTAHGLSPSSMKKSIEMGARAYLPKDQLGRITPFLEVVFTHNYESGWRKLFTKLESSFGKRFGPDWRKSEKDFWEMFEKDPQLKDPTLIAS
jgi:CheY-like chemotaxis protein